MVMRSLSAAMMLFLGAASMAASTAPIILTSLSPQITMGTAEDQFGLEWEIQFSGFAGSINMELVPSNTAETDYTHEGFLHLTEPITSETRSVPFLLDIPPWPGTDVNGNGIHDFFDVDVPIAHEETIGEYANPNHGAPEPFFATWNRAAGEPSGSVTFDFPELGLSSTHSFYLIHYSGTIEYTRSGETINGQVDAKSIYSPEEDYMRGPLVMTVQPDGDLDFAPGQFTGPNGWVFPYTQGRAFVRSGNQYNAGAFFDDGYGWTGETDYRRFYFRINSPDANNNGTPDLVETDTPAMPPRMEAAKTANGIQITVFGTAGATYSLEANSGVIGEWVGQQNIVMTSGTETVTLPALNPARFFRLKQI